MGHGARELPPDVVGPFRGLLSFEVADAAVFFGRDALIEEALARLATRGTLALVGPRGSGKSSVARAGVLARLVEEGWEPRVAARTSRVAIAEALGADAGAAPEAIAAQVTAREARTVLVVDPLEVDEQDASWLAALVEALVESGRARVLVTIDQARLAAAIAAFPGPFLRVAPLDASAWGDVIDRGVAAYEHAFDPPELRDEIVAELEAEAPPMIAVSFALARAWERRDADKRRLPRAALRAVSPIADALATTADRALARCERPVDAMRALVLAAEGGEADGPSLAELERAGITLRGRLAHEAIVDAWPALRAACARARRDEAIAATLDRALTAGEIAMAKELPRDALPARARSQIDDADRRARADARRRRLFAAALGAIAVVSLGGAAVAWRAREIARVESRQAKTEREALEARRRAVELVSAEAWLRDPARRVELYERALREDRTWDEGWLGLSMALGDLARAGGDVDRARALDAAKAAVSYGAGARGEYALADAYLALGDRDGAKDAWLEAARMAASDQKALAHAALAADAFEEHRWKDAVDEASAAVAGGREDEATLYRLAAAELQTGAPDRAVEHATRALAAPGGGARDRVLRARARWTSDPGAASADLADAAAREPRSPEVLARLAQWALEQGDLDRAERLADAAADAPEKIAFAAAVRARVRLARGKRDEARRAIADALAIDPNDEDARATKDAIDKPESLDAHRAFATGAFDRAMEAGRAPFVARVALARGDAAGALTAIDGALPEADVAARSQLATLRAIARRRLGKPAERDAEGVADSDQPHALRERGFERLARGRATEAARDAELALARDALDGEAMLLWLQAGARDRAKELSARVEIVAPDLAQRAKELAP